MKKKKNIIAYRNVIGAPKCKLKKIRRRNKIHNVHPEQGEKKGNGTTIPAIMKEAVLQ